MNALSRAVSAVCAAMVGLAVAVVPADGVVDTTPPNVNINGGLFYRVGSVLSDSGADPSLPANITWAASDDVGISQLNATADVYNTRGAYQGEYYAQGAALRQMSNIPVYPGGYTYPIVDVYDAAGNGTQGYGSFRGGLIQSNTATLSAGWSSAACNCWSFGSTMKSSTVNAAMSFTVNGNSIAVIGDNAAGRGTFKVLVNGVQQGGTYSESGATLNRSVVYQKRFATKASRTIKIVVVSGRVDVDALVWSTGSVNSYPL